MPRFYGIVKPSANKAAAPGKEKKAGKTPGEPSGKGEGKGAPPAPGDGENGQERSESTE